MKQYISTKVVKAEPMSEEEAISNGYLRPNADSGTNRPGFHISYPDGYQSWCPKEAFEKSYRPVDGVTFSAALEALKAGRKVTRKGWNGRGMFLWLKPAATIKAEWCKDPVLKSIVEGQVGGEITALGTICMYTHDSSGRNAILTGWLASQSDMLCEDWEIMPE